MALGRSSRPLIPGMLMSERIKMSDTPAASVMRRRAAGADWANSDPRRGSECMRRPVKQFELSFQHRDANIRLGAGEISA